MSNNNANQEWMTLLGDKDRTRIPASLVILAMQQGGWRAVNTLNDEARTQERLAAQHWRWSSEYSERSQPREASRRMSKAIAAADLWLALTAFSNALMTQVVAAEETQKRLDAAAPTRNDIAAGSDRDFAEFGGSDEDGISLGERHEQWRTRHD